MFSDNQKGIEMDETATGTWICAALALVAAISPAIFGLVAILQP